MTEKLTPVEYFAEMIARKDNISVYEWNYLVDKANERFKDAIYSAFENGKECGMQIEASYNELLQQAKAKHKKETIDFALHCIMPKLNPDQATIATITDIYDEIFNNENI